MRQSYSLSQQFFAISSTIPDSRVVLAGGLDPISGPRSGFQASVACYDYAAGSVVWLVDNVESHPFRAITHANGVCAAIRPYNFDKSPMGMFRFDLESGEPIQPDSEVSGWKIQYVDAYGDTFFFSWVCDETAYIRAVGGRDGAVKERSFPYLATSEGKTIERVIATGEETFVAVFSLVDGNRVVNSIEDWSFTSAAPTWEKRTRLNHVVRNGSELLCWDCTGRKLAVEILSVETGDPRISFRRPLADVVSVVPIDANSYAILSISGVYVMDASSKTHSQVPGMGPSDFLDFGALAVDAALGKLIVATAGNFQRPGTRLIVLEL